jgi:hypothetical protein
MFLTCVQPLSISFGVDIGFAALWRGVHALRDGYYLGYLYINLSLLMTSMKTMQ